MQALVIKRVDTEANDTLLVEFERPPASTGEFEFQHGQYLTLVEDIAGEEIRRSYSICSPRGGPLVVAIKRIADGAFSSFAHEHYRAGREVRALPPAGDFTCSLNADAEKRYLCIAAGSGITPVISVVETILAEEPGSRVTLLYGNRRTQDIIFRERLLWLKNAHLSRFQWINVLSRETQAAPILNGRIDNRKGAALNRCLIHIGGYDEFFLCGPEAMISEVSRGLRSEGVDASKIHYERFFASADDARVALERHQARVAQYAGLLTQVVVRQAGREIAFELSADGENILDGAIDAGLDLPFSCKGGVCATCKAKLIEGQVDMDINHALSPAEVSEGYILSCQSHPISDRVVIDFDVT